MSNKHYWRSAQSAALLKWAAYGWPMKYTKHTKLHKTHNITGYTSPGRYMVGHTWLPIQPLWNLSCSVPPTPISPWRYKYKYKHTHENVKWNHQKRIHYVSCCLHDPEFFSPTKLISTTQGEIPLDIEMCLFSLRWIKESSEEIRNRAEPLVLSCSDQVGWPCLLSNPN